MPGRSGHGLCEHPAIGQKHAGRKVPRFTRGRPECGANQGLGLLLHHGDQSIPDELTPNPFASRPGFFQTFMYRLAHAATSSSAGA